jgi:phosphoribosylaminoimidazole-succinocarboxamide synthase
MTTKDEPISMTDAPASVWSTDLPLPDRRQGKVRDIYTVPAAAGAPRRVLIVASDRVSAFDVVMPTPIPGKGRLLTSISTHWFEFLRSKNIIGDHLLSTDPADIEGLDEKQRAQLAGRMMLGRAAEVVPVECIVRGYITGSGWKEYQRSQSVCGISLPEGLQQCQQLPEPIFTPSTKADEGHDENISFDEACELVGVDIMNRLRDVSLAIYTLGAEHARSRGILLADTKFEFGYALDDAGNRTDELILIDEVLTPDSSRFWPAEEYEPGRDQNSFDKQIVRNYLQSLVDKGAWDKTPPGPDLPDEITQRAADRYREACDRLFANG